MIRKKYTKPKPQFCIGDTVAYKDNATDHVMFLLIKHIKKRGKGVFFYSEYGFEWIREPHLELIVRK
jgi:hypothetical protein